MFSKDEYKINGRISEAQLQVEDNLKYLFSGLNPFSAGTVFIRQNPMFIDFRLRRIKSIPAL